MQLISSQLLRFKKGVIRNWLGREHYQLMREVKREKNVQHKLETQISTEVCYFQLVEKSLFCSDSSALWLSDPEQGRDPAVGARVGGALELGRRSPGTSLLLPFVSSCPSPTPSWSHISPLKSEGNAICPLTPQAHWRDKITGRKWSMNLL